MTLGNLRSVTIHLLENCIQRLALTQAITPLTLARRIYNKKPHIRLEA